MGRERDREMRCQSEWTKWTTAGDVYVSVRAAAWCWWCSASCRAAAWCDRMDDGWRRVCIRAGRRVCISHGSDLELGERHGLAVVGAAARLLRTALCGHIEDSAGTPEGCVSGQGRPWHRRLGGAIVLQTVCYTIVCRPFEPHSMLYLQGDRSLAHPTKTPPPRPKPATIPLYKNRQQVIIYLPCSPCPVRRRRAWRGAWGRCWRVAVP